MLITCTSDPDTGEFPNHPLQEVEGEVISVVDHFYIQAGVPRLLLVIHYEPPRARREPARVTLARKPEPEATDTLAPHERPLYERLRAWRNGRAEAAASPPYTIVTNAQLVDLVRRRPRSLAELQQVPGIGEKKAASFGEELLLMIAEVTDG